MRADRITLAVTAAEAAECAGLGLRLMYMAYRLSPSGVLLKSNALGAVQGGVMAVMGSAPQLADTGAIAGAVTAECGAHGFEGVYLDFDERTAAAERLIEALSPRLAERGARLYTNPVLDAGGVTVLESSEVTGGSFELYLRELRGVTRSAWRLKSSRSAWTSRCPPRGAAIILRRSGSPGSWTRDS